MMKKIYILGLLLAAVSCQTPLFIDPIGPSKELVLQARLLTSDTLHTVYASYSAHESLSWANDLTVSCFVNGVLAAQTSEVDFEKKAPTDQIDRSLCTYHFRAVIHPGDSVRIEAVGRENRAVARMKAPDAPPVPEVSLEKFTKQDVNGRARAAYRFSLRVQDVPGQRNWYRLVCSSKQVLDWYAHAGSRMADHEGWNRYGEWKKTIQVDNTRDPLLNPDGRTVEEFHHDYLANEYNFFTDELFEDGSIGLTLDAWAYDYIYSYSTSFYGQAQYRSFHTAYFDLQSLSREDYLNSRMLEMDNFYLLPIGFIDSLFSEDLVLPGNVEGGLGLVTVRSVSRAVFDLGERDFFFEDFSHLPLE